MSAGSSRSSSSGRSSGLDARGLRSPDGVQGHRRGPRPAARWPARRPVRPSWRRPKAEAMVAIGGEEVEPRCRCRPAKPSSCRQAEVDGDGEARRQGRRRPPNRPPRTRTFQGATSEELEALAKLPERGPLVGRRARAQAHEPRQGPLPAARRPDEPADHEARADRLLRPDRAGDAAAPRRAAAQPPAVSRTASAARASGRRTSPRPRPTGCGAGTRPASTRARRTPTSSPTDVAALCWLGNQAAFEVHAWTGRLPAPDRPTFALIDIDPGEKTTWDETLELARLYRAAFEHLGVRGLPEADRQARHPGVDADRAEVQLPRHERLGRAAVAGGRGDGARPRFVGVGEVPARRARRGSTTPRTPTSRPSSRRTRFGRRRARRFLRRSPGTSSTTRRSARTRWTIRNVVERVAEVGDLFAGAQTDAQELPKL